MGDSRETTVLHLRGVQRDRVLGELESLLDQAGKLSDAASLLAKDLLGVCSPDDDVGNCGGDANFDTGVALLGEFALEEFVEFGVEDTVCWRSVC